MIDEIKTDFVTWGYSRKGNIVSLRCALAEAMLASRSLHLPDLKADTLDCLYQKAHAKITRRGLTILSYVLVRRGMLQKPLGLDGQIAKKALLIGAYSMVSPSSGANGVNGGSRQLRCSQVAESVACTGFST